MKKMVLRINGFERLLHPDTCKRKDPPHAWVRAYTSDLTELGHLPLRLYAVFDKLRKFAAVIGHPIVACPRTLHQVTGMTPKDLDQLLAEGLVSVGGANEPGPVLDVACRTDSESCRGGKPGDPMEISRSNRAEIVEESQITSTAVSARSPLKQKVSALAKSLAASEGKGRDKRKERKGKQRESGAFNRRWDERPFSELIRKIDRLVRVCGTDDLGQIRRLAHSSLGMTDRQLEAAHAAWKRQGLRGARR